MVRRMESPRAAFGPSYYETCCLVIAFLANLTRPGVFVRALVGPLLLLHGVCDAKLYSIICYICICVYIYGIPWHHFVHKLWASYTIGACDVLFAVQEWMRKRRMARIIDFGAVVAVVGRQW